MRRIGVRELRQNASRYLADVARGESLEITQHGRAIARLVPVPRDSWEEMIASGRVIPAQGTRTRWNSMWIFPRSYAPCATSSVGEAVLRLISHREACAGCNRNGSASAVHRALSR